MTKAQQRLEEIENELIILNEDIDEQDYDMALDNDSDYYQKVRLEAKREGILLGLEEGREENQEIREAIVEFFGMSALKFPFRQVLAEWKITFEGKISQERQEGRKEVIDFIKLLRPDLNSDIIISSRDLEIIEEKFKKEMEKK